ncbi:hypothetical protein DFJ43DRAFT_648518 [Lentinula guzmanii]|uniref:Uncharacterized protein n=1 Tax=Lentinula guzmanii TaxID=2804957 RepID=A0AA38J6J6_9AGAR|nr:hypothetical protein DFJ43DRAFT_648518 [Lentinula guzmanii]
MSHNALLHIPNSLVAIWTRFLPKIVLGRSCSTVVYGFGAVTFAGGIGLSIYFSYQELHCLWIEHKLARCIEHLERAELKSAAANRRCEVLEQISSRGKQMVVDIERWEKTKEELEKILIFNQLPVACAATDGVNPEFEGYDVTVRRKETMRKIKELNELDRRLEEEMKWWNSEGEAKLENNESVTEVRKSRLTNSRSADLLLAFLEFTHL